jgi:serine/threonine-protein kinase RsbT
VSATVANHTERNLSLAPPAAPVRRSTADDGRECVVPIEADTDIVKARKQGRAMGAELGFEAGDLAMIATAISELARNIVLYAGRGEIVVRMLSRQGKRGILLMGRDEGPGIADLTQAMRDGYSTSGGLGLGLPGVRRLMDDFQIDSTPGRGTLVTLWKWKR